MAQGKGLTPNKLIYKILTARGSEVFRSAPYTGLKDCVAGYNTTHSRGAKVSYDKAYRKMREYGVHSEVIQGTVSAGSLAVESLIVIMCSATAETTPRTTATQQYQLNEQVPLFAPAQTLAELGTLARSINTSSKPSSISPGQAIVEGTAAFHSFVMGYTSDIQRAFQQVQAICCK